MPRFVRWILYVLLSVVALLAVAYGAAQIYRPKVLALINENLKSGINGDVNIGGLDYTIFNRFPQLSITLSKIYLRGSRYSVYHQDFFTAEKLYIHVQPMQLLRGVVTLKSITIKNAQVFIFTASNGYTNLDTFKKLDSTKQETKSLISLDVQSIFFENTHFQVTDSVKKKMHALTFLKTNVAILPSDSSMKIDINGLVNFKGLTFNPERGSYLLNKKTQVSLKVKYNPSKRKLLILPSTIKFEKSLVGVTGLIQFASSSRLQLKIQSNQQDFSEGLSIVTKSLREKLEKFQFKEPLNLTVNLDGVLAEGEPKVTVDFSSKENKFSMAKLSIDDFSFVGTFNNHVDTTKLFDDLNSRVTLKTFSAKMEGIPTQGSLSITNLKDPKLKLDAKIKMSLVDLNNSTDITKLRFLDGVVISEVSYDGKLSEYVDKTTTSFTGKLKGKVQIINGAMQLIPQQKKLDQVNAQLHFTEKEMSIDKMNFQINGNPIAVEGKIRGFIPFFFQPKKKGFVNLSIHSPRLDIATLLKPKEARKTANGSEKNKNNTKKIDELIQLLIDKVEFSIDLKVDELLKGTFRGQNLTGKISLLSNQLKAQKVKMDTDGGTIKLGIRMSDLHLPTNHVSLHCEVNDADIKKIFNSFGNFRQKLIKAENVSGKISATVDLSADIDDQFKIDTLTLKGGIELRIKNGKITNFAPLVNMSTFIFKRRDFEEVGFAEISIRSSVLQSFLEIERMEIQSTVLSLFLEGRYSFTDSTNLSIQIPLSNLKRRHKNYKPENVGTDVKVGMSVYLHVYEKDKKIVIAYDPFKRHKKKN